jgi:soluble lytic murein transglycosylase-like protein
VKKRRPLWLYALIAAIPLIILGVWLGLRETSATRQERAYVPPKPEAPPDLEKLRPSFVAGLEAINKSDGTAAVKHLGSFTFGNRAVEEYRLLYLARGHELAKQPTEQRVALARLWDRNPKLAARDDAGNALAGIYAANGDWLNAADVASTLATHAAASPAAAAARWTTIESRFASGDLASLLYAARHLAVRNPREKRAPDAIDVVRTLSGIAADGGIPLTPAERLERGVSLMRDGDPQSALNELNALDGAGVPADLRAPLQLNRGLALNQVRQYEASNRLLEPLAGSAYRVAIPALYTAAKNYRLLAASINPNITKTITVKQQVGTVKVKQGKGKKAKTVTKPKFANVKKNIQLVDLAKKGKKETYERLAVERLKDVLQLKTVADDVRIEVLNTLIELAEAKNQDPYARQLIAELVKLDPRQDPGLQHFWDKAWAAYARGDWNGARELFHFISETYRSTNVRRQSRYWFARAGEHIGRKDESHAIYNELAGAPYEDVYVIYSAAHGGTKLAAAPNPLKSGHPDWNVIAEKEIPSELRLAYELTALADAKDARAEIALNARRINVQYAEALQADLYNSAGNMLEMMRSLRRAYPQIGSVEQDSVPPYFLRMYHPTRFFDAIKKNAEKNGLDPYLVCGLIHQESYYNPKARSAVGATGLMQLMPPTAKELAARLHTSTNLENPDVNIKLGTYHFRGLVNLFGGNTQLAVASYNAGQGNVMKWRRAAPSKPNDEFLESIPFPETRNYVKRVTMLQSAYRRLGQ